MGRTEKLFEQFPPVSTKEWIDSITADLKGADFSKKLVWKTIEGFDVLPFYRQEDLANLKYIESLPGEFPFLRGKKINNNWRIRQDIEVTDYVAANEKALKIMSNGADSLGFVISDPESINEKNFSILLKDISPETVELNFLSNGKAIEILDIITSYINKTGTDPNKICGAIETDPISRLMLNGTLCIPVGQGFDYLAGVVASAYVLPQFRTVHLNASNFGNAGADIVQELAFGISMGAEYLAQLTDRGIKAEIASSKIRFSFGIGSNYFPEIAKLRAARLLWTIVTKGFKVGSDNGHRMEIHCATSKWNKTLYDPYVNMLRTQTEAMAAILGGTDSLTVEPFDIVFRQADDFSERIARNQQLILKEESYFNKVADPAGGSYYIENLTHLISDKAWELFLTIEEQGGFLSSLKKGFIQGKLKESVQHRKNDIARRKMVFLGTSHYPDQDEKMPEGADLRKLFKERSPGYDVTVEPVKLFRGSEEYEKLRLEVEQAAKRPVVFLLTLGNASMRKIRSQFSLNFFGCAGYLVIDNPGFESVNDGVAGALASEADIVVICSSDEEYRNLTPEIYNRLKGRVLVVIAGNPPCYDELRSIGIEHFISIGSDVIETLKLFNKILGITT